MKTKWVRGKLAFIAGCVSIAAISALPGTVYSQAASLTLICQYETVFNSKTSREKRASGEFSAILRLQDAKSGEPNAFIEATTVGCFDYEGTSNAQQIFGQCKRKIGSIEINSSLEINRISGSFSHTMFNKDSYDTYSGKCRVSNQIF